jgi:hypothetical protein
MKYCYRHQNHKTYGDIENFMKNLSNISANKSDKSYYKKNKKKVIFLFSMNKNV